MARKKTSRKRKVENYTHDKQERLNNPPVGLVTPDTDRDELDKTYAYDPHLDPELLTQSYSGPGKRNIPLLTYLLCRCTFTNEKVASSKVCRRSVNT